MTSCIAVLLPGRLAGPCPVIGGRWRPSPTQASVSPPVRGRRTRNLAVVDAGSVHGIAAVHAAGGTKHLPRLAFIGRPGGHNASAAESHHGRWIRRRVVDPTRRWLPAEVGTDECQVGAPTGIQSTAGRHQQVDWMPAIITSSIGPALWGMVPHANQVRQVSHHAPPTGSLTTHATGRCQAQRLLTPASPCPGGGG